MAGEGRPTRHFPTHWFAAQFTPTPGVDRSRNRDCSSAAVHQFVRAAGEGHVAFSTEGLNLPSSATREVPLQCRNDVWLGIGQASLVDIAGVDGAVAYVLATAIVVSQLACADRADAGGVGRATEGKEYRQRGDDRGM